MAKRGSAIPGRRLTNKQPSRIPPWDKQEDSRARRTKRDVSGDMDLGATIRMASAHIPRGGVSPGSRIAWPAPAWKKTSMRSILVALTLALVAGTGPRVLRAETTH